MPDTVLATVILLVEDDPGDALLVQERLDDAEFAVQVRWVRTLAEAEKAMVGNPDCVLLDLGLSDAEGLEGVMSLRHRAPDVPIIVLTGMDDRMLGLAAVAAGAEDYLCKNTVDAGLLDRSIRYALERTRARRAARELLAASLHREENFRLERGLLPTPLLFDPFLSWTARCRPARGEYLLGGDFFDAIQHPDGTLRLLIGDVCGHGAEEAALGVSLRIAWRTLVLSGFPTDRILAMLQQILLVERTNGEFVTLCDLTVDPASERIRYQVAGHWPPVVWSHGQMAPLPTSQRGPPLGLGTAFWHEHNFVLGPGWTLLLYTDGLVEGRTLDSADRLGLEGLLTMLTACHPGQIDVDELISAVETQNSGPLGDDVAAVLVHHRNPAPNGCPA